MNRFFSTPQAVIVGFALTLATAPSFAEPPAWAQKSELTIVESAIALSKDETPYDSNQEDFDILVAAIVATGYNLDPLNGDDDYTVFAPNDFAFLALAGFIDPTDDSFQPTTAEDEMATVTALVTELGADGIIAVLDYHVTEGVRNSNSVTRARKIEMLDGNTISARGGFVEGIGSDADFVETDVRVADGMIHIISTVLLPFEPEE